jgi:hypothetical protein
MKLEYCESGSFIIRDLEMEDLELLYELLSLVELRDENENVYNRSADLFLQELAEGEHKHLIMPRCNIRIIEDTETGHVVLRPESIW